MADEGLDGESTKDQTRAHRKITKSCAGLLNILYSVSGQDNKGRVHVSKGGIRGNHLCS